MLRPQASSRPTPCCVPSQGPLCGEARWSAPGGDGKEGRGMSSGDPSSMGQPVSPTWGCLGPGRGGAGVLTRLWSHGGCGVPSTALDIGVWHVTSAHARCPCPLQAVMASTEEPVGTADSGGDTAGVSGSRRGERWRTTCVAQTPTVTSLGPGGGGWGRRARWDVTVRALGCMAVPVGLFWRPELFTSWELC